MDAPETARAADRLYKEVKVMAVTFHFRPGNRVNEVELARSLGTSRTPLREALNRLASEGLLTAIPNRGFHARELDTAQITALYEYRVLVESGAVRLAGRRASDVEINDLSAFARAGVESRADETHALRQLRFDEAFHEQIAALSGNAEILRSVQSLNERIRFIRWIGLRKGSQSSLPEGHLAILEGLERRNVEAAVALMEAHVEERVARIAELVREGHAEIHTGNRLAAQWLGDAA
ncbi:MAG TPA: GntR family transcriptional regulator [Roseomonas sp.]|jgi:DNA-binding GntR family transcriptional regulator